MTAQQMLMTAAGSRTYNLGSLSLFLLSLARLVSVGIQNCILCNSYINISTQLKNVSLSVEGNVNKFVAVLQ